MRSSPGTKLLVFDFDGTIANTMAMVLRIYNKIAHEFGCTMVGDDIVQVLRHGRPQDLLKASGLSLTRLPRFVIRMRKEIGACMGEVTPVDGMPQAIRELAADSFELGILSSNGVENVGAFLAANGLEKCFSFIRSGVHLFGKDAIIRKVVRARSVARENVVYIGDETRDIEAAKKAGIRVVAVSWGYQAQDILLAGAPDAIVDRPDGLVGCVNQLCNNHF